MTNYVVLKLNDGEPTPRGVPADWHQITAQYAHSPRHAIRMTAEGGGGPGTYIAVPARSWVPHTVEVEQKTAIKFS